MRAKEAKVERDETESSVKTRGEGMRQRALGLAAELREEKAMTAKLRAMSEEGAADTRVRTSTPGAPRSRCLRHPTPAAEAFLGRVSALHPATATDFQRIFSTLLSFA